jgi:hypothetical protein
MLCHPLYDVLPFLCVAPACVSGLASSCKAHLCLIMCELRVFVQAHAVHSRRACIHYCMQLHGCAIMPSGRDALPPMDGYVGDALQTPRSHEGSVSLVCAERVVPIRLCFSSAIQRTHTHTLHGCHCALRVAASLPFHRSDDFNISDRCSDVCHRHGL